MGQQFQVIGDDDVDGDVNTTTGDVLGYGGGVQVLGYDEDGNAVVGRARSRSRTHPVVQLTRPNWRNSQLAPGVIAPDQGLLPLPMGSFTYVAAAQIFTFTGKVQKPFRGERLLVTTVRTGTTATGRVLGQIFIGTDLAAVDTPPFDLEQVGAPGAFGVRLTMKPAQPGVDIKIITALSNAVGGSDTLFCTITLLGRYIG